MYTGMRMDTKAAVLGVLMVAAAAFLVALQFGLVYLGLGVMLGVLGASLVAYGYFFAPSTEPGDGA